MELCSGLGSRTGSALTVCDPLGRPSVSERKGIFCLLHDLPVWMPITVGEKNPRIHQQLAGPLHCLPLAHLTSPSWSMSTLTLALELWVHCPFALGRPSSCSSPGDPHIDHCLMLHCVPVIFIISLPPSTRIGAKAGPV